MMRWVVLGILGAGCVAPAAEPISLEGAEVSGTHETFGKETTGLLIDGDEETVWAGDQHDLTVVPTNLFVKLAEPAVVGAIEVVTIRSKEAIRCKDLEIYARAGDGWAKLGEIKGNTEERFTVDLTPARVELLRLRIRDTEREDHAWPRIHEIRLYPPEGQQPKELQPAPITDEERVEKIYIETTLGLRQPLPTTTYDPAKGYLGYAREAVDTMFAKGTDRYGAVPSPMLVSVLDLTTMEHPGCELPPIEGQRQGDRASMGSNLMHDLPLLIACQRLSEVTGEAKYKDEAEAYVKFFLENCTGTETGLWPWGEHAHWDVYQEKVGHTTHEYLGLPPQPFWDRAYELAPRAVVGEADGCWQHIVNLDTYDYNRHADVSTVLPVPRPADMTFLDFPRHGGFYHYVWAYAYGKTKDPKYLEWIEKLMDHHERATNPDSGLMPTTTSNHPELCLIGTQQSLAVTMLESVPFLGDTPTAKRTEELARRWLDALAALPHKLDTHEILTGLPVAGPADETKRRYQKPTFVRHYGGGGFMGDFAKMCVQAYRVTGDERHLAVARSIGEVYAETPEVPEMADEKNVRSGVYGMMISLMVDLYNEDHDPKWLTAAERYAQEAIGLLYYGGAFRGATDLWYYEAELFPGTLIHALIELDSALKGKPLTPLTFHR